MKKSKEEKKIDATTSRALKGKKENGRTAKAPSSKSQTSKSRASKEQGSKRTPAPKNKNTAQTNAETEEMTKKEPKKSKRKWNRTHSFARKKSTPHQVGHPVYVYGKNGKYRKYLVFTHKPEEGKEDDYQALLHNIDPDITDVNDKSYVKKKFETSHEDRLREPDKKYRIHDEDKETIKTYKK